MASYRLTESDLEILRGRTDTPDVVQALKAIDLKNEWQRKLDGICDVRVWPVVCSVAIMNGAAEFVWPAWNPSWHYTDALGFRGPKYIEVNTIPFTREGWKVAYPDIQKALAAMGFSFEMPTLFSREMGTT